jgi:hypothetical protein
LASSSLRGGFDSTRIFKSSLNRFALKFLPAFCCCAPTSPILRVLRSFELWFFCSSSRITADCSTSVLFRPAGGCTRCSRAERRT